MSEVSPPPTTPPPPRHGPFGGVGARLAAGILLMGLLLLLIAGLALFNLSRYRDALSEIAETTLPGIVSGAELGSMVQIMVAQIDRLAAADSHPERRIALAEIDRQIDDISPLAIRLAAVDKGASLPDLLDVLGRTARDLDQRVGARIDARQRIDDAIAAMAAVQRRLNTAPRAAPDIPLSERLALSDWTARTGMIVNRGFEAARSPHLRALREQSRTVRSALAALETLEADLSGPRRQAAARARTALAATLLGPDGLFVAAETALKVANRAKGLGVQSRRLAEEVAKSARSVFATLDRDASTRAAALSGEVARGIDLFLIILALAGVAAVAIYAYLRRTLTLRLVALNQAVLDRIAGGTGAIDTGGDDEIADIARSIGHFLSEIDTRQQDLAATERRFRDMVHGAVQAILILQDGHPVFYNPSFGRLMGIGGPLDPDQAQMILDGLPAAATLPFVPRTDPAAGTQLERQQITRPDGRRVWVALAYSSIPWAGQLARQITLMDVSGTVTAEQALKEARDRAEDAARAKADFLAAMSHEIRTPMNGLISMARMLAQTRLDDEQRDMIRVIGQSADTLLALLNDVLDVSRMEAGKLEIEPAPFDLPAVIESVESLWAAEANKKRIDLAYEIDPRLADTVIGDGNRLRQILANLVGNAVKFTETGHVMVRVFPDPRRDGRKLRIEVEDTGIGIPSSAMNRLFLPFEQADRSTARRFGGSGLGLSICKNLVELMGGTIDVDSHPGAGSVFQITLALPPADVQTPAPSFSPARVAVMAPVPLDRAWRTMADAIGHHSVATDAAQTGEADILLCDAAKIDPPLIERLRALATNGPRLLVVARRGTELPDNLPVAGRLNKPLQRAALNHAIAAALDRSPPPIAIPATSPPPRYRAPSHTDAAAAGTLILAAEDNETNRAVIRKIMARLGFALDIAENGAQALTRYRTESYGLILTDCHMPVLDGFELARTIRREEPPGRHIPILALTADALAGTAARCRQAGMDGYLEKPVDMAVLEAEILRWLPRAGEMRRRTAGLTPPAATAPPSGPSEVPIFDTEPILTAFGGFDTEAREIVAGFFDSARSWRTTLEDCLLSGQLTEAATVAHTAKGSARSVGAVALGEVFAALETAARSNDIAAAGAALRRLDPEILAFEHETARHFNP